MEIAVRHECGQIIIELVDVAGEMQVSMGLTYRDANRMAADITALLPESFPLQESWLEAHPIEKQAS